MALLAGGLLAGGAAAGAVGVLAATAAPIALTAATSSTTEGPGQGHQHGSAAVRSDEKTVTGTTAATLKAAALKAVPGGTVYRIETDAGDGAYEAHMTKSDGTEVTVKFDKNLAVTAVEDGMGKGDPRPSGGRGAPRA
jgi:uncharacterized membrane protein YkoI